VTQKWTHRYEIKPNRWVFVPTDEAKKTGRRVKKAVEAHWAPPTFYFHLRSGGHVAALRSHDRHNFFFRVDLENFFGQVSRSRVTRCLKYWFSYKDAREMASESVVRVPVGGGFCLPYGFVQSSILAALAMDRSKLGSYLRSIERNAIFKVSVYVDDIIISSDDLAALRQAALDLRVAADKSLFPISVGKTEGPANQITAFNIELAHKRQGVTPARLAEFIAAYRTTSNGNVQDGIRGYVASIDAAQVAAL
jgi:hypothetical protein